MRRDLAVDELTLEEAMAQVHAINHNARLHLAFRSPCYTVVIDDLDGGIVARTNRSMGVAFVEAVGAYKAQRRIFNEG